MAYTMCSITFVLPRLALLLSALRSASDKGVACAAPARSSKTQSTSLPIAHMVYVSTFRPSNAKIPFTL